MSSLNCHSGLFHLHAINVVRYARRLHTVTAALLATVYFLFQTEPFELEYEEQHPDRAETVVFAKPSITWESFDKQNAPQAFRVEPWISLGPLGQIENPVVELPLLVLSFHPVRDKSPPFLPS